MDQGLIPQRTNSTPSYTNQTSASSSFSRILNPSSYATTGQIGQSVGNHTSQHLARATQDPGGRSTSEGGTLIDFLRSTTEASHHHRNFSPQEPEGHSRGLQQRNNAAQGYQATLPHNRKRVGSLQQDESSGKRRSNGSALSPQMQGASGSDSANPIDLTSPPRLQRPHRMDSSDRRTSSSSIVLPKWQPDEEVSRCPVCRTPFGFLYRRHHCRKCGKVVCANCSPHRITIPRQFIVHPPPSTTAGPLAALSTSLEPSHFGHASTSPRGPSTSVSGGEVVRVCNPCVPDPNFSPPPQIQSPPHNVSLTSPFGNVSPSRYPSGPHEPAFMQPRRASGQSPSYHHPTIPPHMTASPYRPSYQPTRRPSAPTRDYGQSSSGSAQRVSPLHSTTQYPGGPMQASTAHNFAISGPSESGLHPPRRSTISSANNHYVSPRSFLDSTAPPLPPFAVRQHRTSQPVGSSRSYTSHSGLHQRPQGAAPIPPQQESRPPAPATAPRRVIAEEDECPVCGMELPPAGPNGDETPRTQHVEMCLRLYSSGASPSHTASVNTTPSQPSASTSLPPRLPGTNPASSASSFPAFNQGPSQHAAAPSTMTQLPQNEQPTAQQARRMTGGRMLVYRASEKDCLAEDGDTQECIICFEEFAVGDEMARLECLCKFHKACIRSWWETKGAGSCPTHQLHQ